MPPEIDTGDTTWVLISAALVMIMTPGVGFFYGGLVRSKSATATIMHSFGILAVVSVVWVLWGYTLAFGPNELGGFIGNLSWFGLRNVGLEPSDVYATTVPHQAFMVFQMMFAVITPALITGAFAERAKFSTFLVFTVVWVTVVYAPVAHWVWGQGGWLQSVGLGEGGALDFAGGTVVHINAGVAALAAALVFGRRVGFGREAMEPHNVSMVVLGAVLLWFGWFGFNGGSALAAGGLAANAFVVTHVASATAALTWVGLSWYLLKKPSVVGAATGAVAGLVAITPAAGFIGSWPAADGYLDAFPAILIGLGAGLFTYLAVQLRIKLSLDDSLDVWGVHGIGGTWGAFATGIFAVAAVGGASGLIDGNAGQLGKQLAGIGAVWGYSFVLTFAILKVLDVVMGLRVSEEAERLGLDASQHGERGYVLGEAGPLAPAQAPASAPRPAPQPVPQQASSEAS